MEGKSCDRGWRDYDFDTQSVQRVSGGLRDDDQELEDRDDCVRKSVRLLPFLDLPKMANGNGKCGSVIFHI